MLVEYENLSQNEADSRRRLFSDSYFDLYVWYAADGALEGFQLCYDKGGFERAVTFTKGSHYSHLRVDQGEDGSIKASPVLAQDGNFDKQAVLARLETASRDLPDAIRGFVLGKLSEGESF